MKGDNSQLKTKCLKGGSYPKASLNNNNPYPNNKNQSKRDPL